MRINKDQFSSSIFGNLKFIYLRGRKHIFPFLLNRFRWHYYPRMHYVSRFPSHLDIEISSLCNMQCPMCFTMAGKFIKEQKRGFMPFPLFKKIIDEAVKFNIYSIRLSYRGEAFIHPEVIEFIKYAKRSGVKEVASLSNILALTPSLFTESMKAGLDWLTISFDGLGDTYEQIRKPAKFQEAYDKIKEYKKIKNKARSYKPVIKIQSIWPVIKDEVEEYVELFKPYVDAIVFNPLVDYLHKDDPQDIEYWKNFDCPTPYQRLTILFNGVIPYCINDEFITFTVGDVNSSTIYDIWHSKGMAKVRMAHKRHEGISTLPACKYCFLPRKTEPVTQKIGDREITVGKYTNRLQEVGR